LTEAYLEQIVTLEEYRRRRRELEERAEAIEAQMRQLEASIDRQVELTAIADGIESFCQRVQQGLAQATFEQKRHLVELLIDRVIVTGEQVEIRYVIPTSPRGEQSRFYQLRLDYCRTVPPQFQSGMLTDPPTSHRCREVREVTERFPLHYNQERPNLGRSCQNQPPRVAFPTLPVLPPLPEKVDPDRWLGKHS